MRSLQRRKQDIWFVGRERDDSQLRQVYVYDKPVKKRFSVSLTSGNPMESYYGTVPSYDRYIICYEHDYVPAEGILAYVDRVPELDAEGNLVLNADDAPTVLPDYVVSKIARTEKGYTVRVGITKLSDGGSDTETIDTSPVVDDGDGGSLG